MESAEQLYPTDRSRLRQWFPWLHLFRAFRIALGMRSILLGVAAVLLMDAAQQLMTTLPFSKGIVAESEWGQRYDFAARRPLVVSWTELGSRPLGVLDDAANHTAEIVRPLWTIVAPGRWLFVRGHSWSEVATAWTQILWALIVWGIFGVALARMAALRFAADDSLRTRTSLRYALEKLVSSLGAPLLPLVGVLLLWMICLVGGLFGRIPTIGPILMGVFWWLPLLLAGLMALVLLGIAAGWPLMLSSIGTEDADAFDAFSRVYSYLFTRPWYALSLATVALIYGSLLLTFVATVIEFVIPLAEWAVASGMGTDRTEELLRTRGEGAGFAAAAVHFWNRVVGLGIAGFVVSYFWTAVTIIYFLLRKSVDAMPLDAVSRRSPEMASTANAALPLAGIAAAERQRQETTPATTEAEAGG